METADTAEPSCDRPNRAPADGPPEEAVAVPKPVAGAEPLPATQAATGEASRGPEPVSGESAGEAVEGGVAGGEVWPVSGGAAEGVSGLAGVGGAGLGGGVAGGEVWPVSGGAAEGVSGLAGVGGAGQEGKVAGGEVRPVSGGAADGDPGLAGAGGVAAKEHAHVSFASSPLAALREGRLTRRFTQLYAGLALYGISMALMLRSGLGLDPWDVFHQGVTNHTPFSFGTVVIIASFVVLLAWIPLRQWPGIGTISNAIVIGLVTDAGLAILTQPTSLVLQIVFLVSGILLNGVASAAYIGARFGPGPRDGLMTGLVRKTGKSVRLVRTSIEVTVLAIGWLMGGTVGVGTILYAISIGPLIHGLLPRLTVLPVERKRPVATPQAPSPAKA